MSLLYDKAVIERLCAEGFSAEFGVMELSRTVQRLIESPLFKLLAIRLDTGACCIRCVEEKECILIRYD